MSNAIHILKRALENSKANAIGLNRELTEAKKEVNRVEAAVEVAYKQVQEIEEAIIKLENKDASKNQKTKR